MASLGKDIADIRQGKNLTLEQIHDETKIPLHILESIESGIIFDDINKNRTYIRSFVRSYAKRLNIPEDLIVLCLDKVEQDNYNGELKTGGKQSERDKTGKQDSKMDKKGGDKKSEKPQPQKNRPKKWAYDQTSSPEPNVHSVDWSDMSGKVSEMRSSKPIIIIAALSIVIVVVAAGYFFLRPESEPVETSVQTEAPLKNVLPVDSIQTTTTVSDTAANNDSTQRVDSANTDSAQAAASLPDTLNLVVYAAYDKLEPVRIISDIDGSINPYWIEKGDAMRFPFLDSIKVRGQYNRMILFLNGHLLEDFRSLYYDSNDRFIELFRSSFIEPKWRTPPPDSLPIDVAPPTEIRNRPTF